jgi:sulfur carrier protein
MKISINGKEVILAENPERTVDSLLEELDVSQRLYVTVELNGEILDRPAFEGTQVKEGDVIEFLYFMGGGSALFA